MTNYFDLTKLFIRSLKINKQNRKNGKFFFYSLFVLSIILVFIPILFIYTIFVFNTMSKFDELNFAVVGFEALLFIISIFSFLFGFNVLLNELYFSEDIENILPLPIKPETIVASKFTSCFFIENVILFIFLIFAAFSYVLALQLPITHLLLSLIGIIFLPLIPMVFCTLILFLVINLLRKFLSNKAIKSIGYILLGVFILFVFFLLLKIASINFEQYIEDFASGDHTFLEVMRYIFPSVYFFARGLNEGSILFTIISIVISIIYFGIMLLFAKKFYYNSVVEITSKDTRSKKYAHKKISEFKVRNQLSSSFIKDIKMILRSPTFFINCVVINIIWPILIFLIFKIALPSYTIDYMRNAIMTNDTLFFSRMILIVIGVSIIVPAFNSLSSSAFSREGKNFHFIKYIPMKYGLQWREKYLVSFIITFIGITFYSIPFFLIIHMPILIILLYLLLIILCISFVTLIGLLIDSAFPKLTWDDEADSLRENFNAFIAMGYSLLIFALLCGGGYYLLDNNKLSLNAFTLISLAILFVGNIIFYIISHKKISSNIMKQEV